MDNRSEIIIYNTEDGKCKIDVRLEDDNVWLTQEQMAEALGMSIPTYKAKEDGKSDWKLSEMNKFTVYAFGIS